jgi:hypothetical protein
MKLKTPEKFYRQFPTAHWIGNRPKKTGPQASLRLILLKYTIGMNPLSIRIFLIWVRTGMTKETFPNRKISLQNLKKINAQKVLENSDESTYFNEWKMEMDGNVLFPPMPKVQVIRAFLYNHLYHHRGELVVYLRSTGNKVPGLYGPTADDNM